MSNMKELTKRIDQCKGFIDSLIWIGGTDLGNNESLKELIQDSPDEDLNKFFPNIAAYVGIDIDDSALITEYLYDNSKRGFIAKILIPHCDGFRLDEHDVIKGYSRTRGICRFRMAYGDDLDSLVSNIEEVSNEVFQEFFQKWKLKQPAKK